jgi:hypothetical protein
MTMRVNALANDDLRDAAHDRGELAGGRRLQIWRAAYAAAVSDQPSDTKTVSDAADTRVRSYSTMRKSMTSGR